MFSDMPKANVDGGIKSITNKFQSDSRVNSNGSGNWLHFYYPVTDYNSFEFSIQYLGNAYNGTVYFYPESGGEVNFGDNGTIDISGETELHLGIVVCGNTGNWVSYMFNYTIS